MPRKAKSDALRLLEGRSPGRDSGGRLVKPPVAGFAYPMAPRPRPGREGAPPRMPAGLPAPVKAQWRRVVRELLDLGAVMPPQDRLEGYCRDHVERHTVAAAKEDAAPGSVQWSRLNAREDQLAKRIARFIREYYCPPPAAPVNPGGVNPFAGRDASGRRPKTPSLTKGLATRPMPEKYWEGGENPCPPVDPRYHAAWVERQRESDKAHGITREPGFYRREFHYDDNGNLWDEYKSEPDVPGDGDDGRRDE